MEYCRGKIICLTQEGYTARMISKYGPTLPIFGVTPEVRTAREMRLVWGVEPLLLPELAKTAHTISRIKTAVKVCLEQGYIEGDEKPVLVGNLLNLPLRTNMVSIFS